MKTTLVLLLLLALSIVVALAAELDGDANFPTTNGRTYHLEVQAGDVANRIVTVGDLERAETYARYLTDIRFNHLSKRGFKIITGSYKGVPVSIIGTGMGTPMIDFTIRETRAVITGEMAMIRIGTCGSPAADVALGDVVVNNASVYVRRDPDLYRLGSRLPYTMSSPIKPDRTLSQLLLNGLRNVPNVPVHTGLGVTTDSFYSSQGRQTTGFNDRNSQLIDTLVKKFPSLKTIEMETFHLLDLGSQEVSGGQFHAAAAMLVVAQRFTDKFIDDALRQNRERTIGVGALDALAAFDLTNA